jgi:hypothetical protein
MLLSASPPNKAMQPTGAPRPRLIAMAFGGHDALSDPAFDHDQNSCQLLKLRGLRMGTTEQQAETGTAGNEGRVGRHGTVVVNRDAF